MKKGTIPSVIGILLLILSAPVIFLIFQENYYKQEVNNDYDTWNVGLNKKGSYFIVDNGNFGIESIGKAYIYTEDVIEEITIPSLSLFDIQLRRVGKKGVFKQTLQYGDNIIQIEDTFPLKDSFNMDKVFPEKVSSLVNIRINKKDFSTSTPIVVHPGDISDSRYYGYVGFMLVKDKKKKSESLLLIQRFGDGFKIKENKWRFLWIFKNGLIKEESFDYKERQEQPYRTSFINASMTTPTFLGYKSNVETFYPTYFYPLMYPWSSFILGLVLSIYGLYRLATFKKKEHRFSE